MQDNRSLLIATDEVVLDETLRIAAAVGCETERAPDLTAARQRWLRAPLVVLDEQAVRQGADDLPRRPNVFVVCREAPAPESWRSAFDLGAKQVLTLPDDESRLVAAFADLAEGPGEPGGRVLAVLGGRGGAGASVFATAIGLTALQHGKDGLLVDCDSLGGGLDLLLGAELDGGMRWPDLDLKSGRVSMTALGEALPARREGGNQLSFISCRRGGRSPSSEAVEAVIAAGRRAGRVVVCDVPRGLGAPGRVAVRRAELIVIVLPAELRACVAAERMLSGLTEAKDRIRLVVRRTKAAGPIPEEMAAALELPLLTTMNPERGLDRALEHGRFEPVPHGPLASAAAAVLGTRGTEPILDVDQW